MVRIGRALGIACAGLALGMVSCAPQTPLPAEVAEVEDRPEAPRSEPQFGPMLYPGERFEAQISRGMLTVGSVSLVVDAPCLQDGVEVVPTSSHAERVGLYGAVKPGKVDTVSWLDRATGLPRWTRSAPTSLAGHWRYSRGANDRLSPSRPALPTPRSPATVVPSRGLSCLLTLFPPEKAGGERQEVGPGARLRA